MKPQMNRNISVDLLKLSMSFLVILIHYPPNLDSYLLIYIINDIVRIAVPVFFMISGFYLFKSVSEKSIDKSLSKLFTIYLSWMTIYFIYFNFIKDDTPSAYYIISNVIQGWFHLWYFPASIMAIFIASIIKNKKTTIIIITISMILLFIFYFLQLEKLSLVNIYAYRNFIFFGLPCVLIGGVLYRYEANINRKTLFYFLIISCPIIITWYYMFYIEKKVILELPLTSLIFSIFVVSLVMKVNIKSSVNIGKLSTTIYLSHPIFMDVINHFNFCFILSYLMIIMMCVFLYFIVNLMNIKYIV
ncbi:acyltransferase family protein [Proteus mirabilis]|nr:acyltransferase family protein [Proteus mirabilis]